MERGRCMLAFAFKVWPGNLAALPAPLKVQKPSREPDVPFFGGSHMRLPSFHPSGMPGLGNVVCSCAKPRPCVAMCQAVPSGEGRKGGKHRQGAATRPHLPAVVGHHVLPFSFCLEHVLHQGVAVFQDVPRSPNWIVWHALHGFKWLQMKAGTGAGVQLGFNGLRFPKCVDASLAGALAVVIA